MGDDYDGGSGAVSIIWMQADKFQSQRRPNEQQQQRRQQQKEK